MAVVFELARSIHSTVPQFRIPCSIPHLEPEEGQGGGQRKTQKPEVCLEFIPLNISHSWTKKISISQQQGNHVLHNSETHTPKTKTGWKQLHKSKSSKGLYNGDMKPFWALNHLTWTLSVTELILCSVPPLLWGKQSQNSITQIPLLKKPDILILQLKKKIQVLHTNLILFFLRHKKHSIKLLKCPEKFISPFGIYTYKQQIFQWHKSTGLKARERGRVGSLVTPQKKCS